MTSAVAPEKRRLRRRTARTELESDFEDCGTSRQRTFFVIGLPGRASTTLRHAAKQIIGKFTVKGEMSAKAPVTPKVP